MGKRPDAAEFVPVWWSSTGKRTHGAHTSGKLAHRLKLGGPTRSDVRLQELLVKTRHPRVTSFARTTTKFAGGFSPYPLLAVFVAAASPPGQRRDAVTWSLRRLGTGLGVRFALAQSLRRARPDRSGWLANSTGFSWPSGHTTAITLTTALAVEAALDAGMPMGKVLAAAAPLPLVIGWSRVYLGVHWPSDVLAGWLLGLLLLPVSGQIPDKDPVWAAIMRAVDARR